MIVLITAAVVRVEEARVVWKIRNGVRALFGRVRQLLRVAARDGNRLDVEDS